MTTVLQKFFDSVGLKRKVATYLTAVMTVIAQYPDLQVALPLLQYIAGFFGITGIVHALNNGTIQKFKLTSLASLFGVLIAAAAHIGALKPYAALLQELGLVISVFASGHTLATSKK